ncbi:hypothetical protein BC828DRAFT_39542 [Blastocladiella britannica]|nr:hypothetical protein BC828DRAFT_39542 [Blastocladiella britannica]
MVNRISMRSRRTRAYGIGSDLRERIARSRSTISGPRRCWSPWEVCTAISSKSSLLTGTRPSPTWSRAAPITLCTSGTCLQTRRCLISHMLLQMAHPRSSTFTRSPASPSGHTRALSIAYSTLRQPTLDPDLLFPSPRTGNCISGSSLYPRILLLRHRCGWWMSRNEARVHIGSPPHAIRRTSCGSSNSPSPRPLART